MARHLQGAGVHNAALNMCTECTLAFRRTSSGFTAADEGFLGNKKFKQKNLKKKEKEERTRNQQISISVSLVEPDGSLWQPSSPAFFQ